MILHITSGSGPCECRRLVKLAADALVKEAGKAGLCAEVTGGGSTSSYEADSLFVSLKGKNTRQFADSWTGTIKWVCQSPFRPRYKRKNWFCAVKQAGQAKDVPELVASDVRFQTMRASGPGGQHVNTTDSAVRATHLPSGLQVVAMEERSQHANRKRALVKLAALISAQKKANEADAREQSWRQNHQLERGNAIRSYHGPSFRLK